MRRFGLGAVMLALSTAAPANAQFTECFTEQAMQKPAPVLAGMSRIQVVGFGQDQIFSESLFDDGGGVGEPYSWLANHLAGATSCERNPDVRAMWSYIISDDNVNDHATITLTTTYFSAQTAERPTGTTCTTTTNPQIRVVQIDTGPEDLWRKSYAGSTLFSWNLGGCDANHDWFQGRVRGVATTTLGGSVTDQGCFLVPFRGTPAPCPTGSASSCLL